MPRQQTSFIVQYLHAFQSKDFLYFLTRQPNEFEPKSSTTKIVRFCRENSNSILRSYAELPLICVNADWILKSAEVFLDRNDEEILVGHFTRKEGNVGTTLCSWNVRRDIDRAFEETYRQCYSMGIGQRGLTFIKPNEICRRDEVSGRRPGEIFIDFLFASELGDADEQRTILFGDANRSVALSGGRHDAADRTIVLRAFQRDDIGIENRDVRREEEFVSTSSRFKQRNAENGPCMSSLSLHILLRFQRRCSTIVWPPNGSIPI